MTGGRRRLCGGAPWRHLETSQHMPTYSLSTTGEGEESVATTGHSGKSGGEYTNNHGFVMSDLALTCLGYILL